MDRNDNQLPSISGSGPVAPPSDVAQQTSAALSPPPVSAPAIADDADLIEKEWVMKARQIVEQTKADPYAQNQQMNQMKADYIKKRYNKDLKVEET